MLKKIPFAVQSYRAKSLYLSQQRLVNLYPEIEPQESKSGLALYGTPGQVAFCDLPNIRGLHKMDGVLYAVSNTTLYSISSAGVSTDLGEVPGTGFVGMATNGTQLVIVTNPDAYIYDGTLAQITDPDSPGS